MADEYRDFGPVPWWAWTGKMEKTQMLKQLKQLKAGGIDEFFIFALYGLEKPEFLEESWFDYVGYTLECSKKLGMKVWIYDDLNWPSGSAGGRLLREHPEFRSKSIVMSKIADSNKFSSDQYPVPVRVFCGNREHGYKSIDVKNGDSPEKGMEYLVFEEKYGNLTLLNTRGLPDSIGERGYFDMFNPASVRCWMSYIHEEYLRRFKAEFGKTLRGFFFDEPYIMELYAFGEKCSSIPWTPEFNQKFKKLYNYNFYDFLPELFLNVSGGERVRNDYWRMVSEAGGAGMGEVGKWCEKHGVMSTGHCVYEEPKFQREKLLMTPTMYDLLKHHSAPGMDLLGNCNSYMIDPDGMWYGKEPGVERNFTITAKLLTSTARYSGAKRIMAEAMGVRSWGGLPAEQKILMDWLAGMGVNLLNDNSFVYSIAGFRKRGIAGKHFTQPYYYLYKLFSDYCRNLAKFSTFGQLHTSLAVLLPDTSIRIGTPAATNEPFRNNGHCSEAILRTVEVLLDKHLDFELLFTPVLENAIVKSDGVLHGSNCNFKTVLVPRPTALTSLELEKLHSFVKAGGRVVWLGNRPEIIPDQMKSIPDWVKSMPYWDDAAMGKEQFADELNNFVRADNSILYSLSGISNEWIMSTLRSSKDEFKLLLSNQSKNPITFNLHWAGKSFNSFSDTSENIDYNWDMDNCTDMIIQPYQSWVFSTAKNKNAKDIKQATVFGRAKSVELVLNEEFDYELSAPNCAQICFDMALPSVGGKLNFDIPVARNGRHGVEFSPAQYKYYYLAGDFEFATQIPSDFGILTDDSSVEEIILNGVALTKKIKKTLWDAENRFYAAAFAAKKGKNHIQLKIKTSSWNSSYERQIFPANCIEPLVLTGSFGVSFNERSTILKALPKKLRVGDIAGQGFPQYIGKIIYRQNFIFSGKINDALRIECQAGASLRMSLNHKLLGERLWGPYRFKCENLNYGNNLLELEVSTTLGNVLRYAYFSTMRPAAECGVMSDVLISKF